MTTQTFGDFIEMEDKMKYLKLGFSLTDLPFKQRWRTNGLSADFIAEYLQFFFKDTSTNDKKNWQAPIPVQSKGAVKYIANELLENAMKYADDQSSYPTKVGFYLYNDKLVFNIVNSIKPTDVEKFQVFIKQLTDEEPCDLYFRRMVDNANCDKQSGLGLLSMICDYAAEIGWKFEPLQTEPPIFTVSTMVCLNL
jgi:hypothetical protein